ncbi:hypothetical protein ACJMK2_033525 [Sinanodonta woodiana]|uniref:Ribosomal protein L5 n=1 Tax=Sinanodonta woodiana TaxID=1069815 RepID=A0ABD3WS68_SINWO
MITITYFDRVFVNLDLKGNATAINLSIPIAMFVKTLPTTDRSCINKTIGHMGFENIQFLSISEIKVKGIQNSAIIKSATARLIKNGRRSVLERLPRAKTKTTNKFPTMERSAVSEYNTINPACDSDDRANELVELKFVPFVSVSTCTSLRTGVKDELFPFCDMKEQMTMFLQNPILFQTSHHFPQFELRPTHLQLL